MLPYLIAGAIGFGIGKLFEEGGEAGEKYVNGGGVSEYFKKFENDFYTTRRGGVKNYSVDIDLENGEQLRGGDLDFKDGNDALFLYERIKKKGEYQNEKIENIQLIANFKNGDYESIHIPRYVNGGGVGKYKMYKLRAEGLNDFINFLGTGVYFNVKSFTVEPIGVPDVVVSFETNLSLSEIKAKLREVQDSHVMLETIKPIKEYTGERYAGGGKAGMIHYYIGGLVSEDIPFVYKGEEEDINYEVGFHEGGIDLETFKETPSGYYVRIMPYGSTNIRRFVYPEKDIEIAYLSELRAITMLLFEADKDTKENQKIAIKEGKKNLPKLLKYMSENVEEEDEFRKNVRIVQDAMWGGDEDEDEDEYAVGGVAKKRRRSASAQ